MPLLNWTRRGAEQLHTQIDGNYFMKLNGRHDNKKTIALNMEWNVARRREQMNAADAAAVWDAERDLLP